MQFHMLIEHTILLLSQFEYWNNKQNKSIGYYWNSLEIGHFAEDVATYWGKSVELEPKIDETWVQSDW